ncbi:SoxR reducing system RseC family protein [bacterium]|nr:SoxR reducing system RseC family protein [bacterium]
MSIKERAKVVEIRGENASVRVISTDSCSDCSEKDSCILSKKRQGDMEIRNMLNAQKGDTVEIELTSGAYLGLGFLVFIVPIISLIIFYLIGYYTIGQTAGVIFAFLGLSAGMLVAFVLSKGKGAEKFKYKMIGKIENPDNL